MNVISPNLVENLLSERDIASGRSVIVTDISTPDAVRICAVSKSIEYSGEPIDITQDCDDGYEVLAGFTRPKRLTIELDGYVARNDRVVTKGLQNQVMRKIQIHVPGNFTISGDFMLVGFTITGELREALSFTATLRSSGKWNYLDGSQ